jgi:pimeloyl-ACP methyl ester carboxylesterase
MGAAVTKAVTDWNGSVAGANDPSCRPSVEHPNPVLLVGSTFLSDAVNWTSLAPYLYNAGFCVYTLNYGRSMYRIPPGLDGLDPMVMSAREVAERAMAVLRDTGAKKLDIVGHSQGGVVARIAINRDGLAPVVGQMVLMSSPYSATGLPIDVAKIASDTVPEPLWNAVERNGFIPIPYATFMNPWALRQAFPLQPTITYTEITDVADEVGLLGGMSPPLGASNAITRYVNQVCPTDFSQHFMQPYSATAVAMVATALAPQHPVTGVCQLVPLYRP